MTESEMSPDVRSTRLKKSLTALETKAEGEIPAMFQTGTPQSNGRLNV